MTSLFQVIAHEDANDQSKLRQAMALSHQRVEDRFGLFVRKGSIEDQGARYSLVEEDIRAVVAAACEQVGYADVDGILSSIGKNFINAPEVRKIASTVHEARKPKMCPYHSEVTDISLAEGSPQAGFNAMAQHAWSAKHCQGEEYEGDRCKFKPEMTTQAYWDARAEKLEQKRQERAERLEQEQQTDQTAEGEEIHDLNSEPVADLEGGDLADAPVEHNEPSAIGEGVSETPQAEIPMAMAASARDAATFEVVLKGRNGFTTSIPVQANDEYEARQLAIRQSVSQGNPSAWADQVYRTGSLNIEVVSVTKIADGGPVPVMDKSKWTPKSVPELDADEDDGRWPTRRKDVTQAIDMDQGTRFNPSKLTEIGEAVTETQDVAEDTGVSTSGQGGTFGGGERSAVSSLLSPEEVREVLAKTKRD